MKKILITGASGFVGSHLVEEALNRNLEVYAGIRKTSSRKYLQHPDLKFAELNFEDQDSLKKLVDDHEFDYIIHNAGLVNAARLDDFWRVNFEYVKNFTAALDGRQPQKFTFISSLAAYGPASNDDPNDYLYEERIPKPINTYGKSKLAAEQHLRSLDKLPHVIIRPGGVYGPRDQDFFTFYKLLNRGIEAYIGKRPQQLALIYVKDLVRVVLDATLSDKTNKGYFVSDGKYYTQHQLGDAAKKAIGKKTIRFHVPLKAVRAVAWCMEQFGKGNGRHPALNLEKVRILESLNWKCDIKPLVEDYNFKPALSLEEGVAESIEWYKKEGWL
jgi:nucleoside-diphosphate-sugar epimerase